MVNKIEVPEPDATYLRANYKTQGVKEMARKLKRATVTIYKFMDALGLDPKPREPSSGNAFRKANNRLESFFIDRKELNKNRKAGYFGSSKNIPDGDF